MNWLSNSTPFDGAKTLDICQLSWYKMMEMGLNVIHVGLGDCISVHLAVELQFGVGVGELDQCNGNEVTTW